MHSRRGKRLHNKASGHRSAVLDAEELSKGEGAIDAVAPEALAAQASPSDPGQARILLVDDRPENLLALSALLEPLEEIVVCASSGEEALRCLLRDEYALILMDAEMPGMNGFETAEIIRQREKTRTLPIIFVTAYNAERQHMFRGYSVGAVDYIPKPFDPDILRSKVRVFVDLYNKTQQIKEQGELIRQSQLREAEREKNELQERMEREHLRTLKEELEKRVAERTQELLEANKELEAFCYSVSHDLRAPLRAICATSEFLLRDAAERLSEDDRDNLKIQSSEAKRLARLIDNLLEFSRLGRTDLRRVKVDLSEVARSVAGEITTIAPEKKVEYQIPKGIKADGDAELLRMVLFNLIENAQKYSVEGTRIEFGFCKNAGTPTYYVKDNGIGFDMKYSAKIFLPFERLINDPNYEGTGIGLANVQRIVNRHGGRVWAESEPGNGSTFYFTLS